MDRRGGHGVTVVPSGVSDYSFRYSVERPGVALQNWTTRRLL